MQGTFLQAQRSDEEEGTTTCAGGLELGRRWVQGLDVEKAVVGAVVDAKVLSSGALGPPFAVAQKLAVQAGPERELAVEADDSVAQWGRVHMLVIVLGIGDSKAAAHRMVGSAGVHESMFLVELVQGDSTLPDVHHEAGALQLE